MIKRSIFALFLLPYLAAAQDFGPIETRNNRALSLPFLRIDPRGPVLPKGSRELSLGFTSANDIRFATTGSRTVDEDYESDILRVRVRMGLGRHLDASLELPLTTRGGGFMDGIIENWHRYVVGIHNSIRETSPFGRSFINLPGASYGSASGIGDLSGAVTLGLGPRSLATAAVKLPTGRARQLLGSGAVDVGLGLQHEVLLKRRLFLDLQVADILQGKSTELNGTRRSILQEGATLRWEKNSRDNWVAQLQNEPSATVTGVAASDDVHRVLTFGLQRKLSDRQLLELFFTENGDFATAVTRVGPDFTIGVRIASRF